MRLRKHGIWLLGASLAPHRVLAADAPSVGQTITFSSGQFVPDIPFQKGVVFVNPGRRTFSFSSTADINIGNVFLRAADESGVVLGTGQDTVASPSLSVTPTIDGGNVIHNTASPRPSHDGGIQQDQMLGRRDSPNVAMSLSTTTPQSGGVNGDIFFPNLINQGQPGDNGSLPSNYYGKVLYLEVDWSRGTAEGGKSFSHYFAVSKSNVPVNDGRLESPVVPTEVQPTPGASTSTSAPGVPGLATSTPSTNNPSSPSSGAASVSAASSTSTSLSIGAIVGIAVGCGIVGLALAALLVFFLMRRRRRGDDGRAAYHDGTMTSGHAAGGVGPYGASAAAGGHRRTADLIAEKEATSGVTETPHSPYSDDGQPVHADPNGSAATAASAAMLQHQGGGGGGAGTDREYAPYSDQASTAATAVATAHDHAESSPHHAPPSDHARSGSAGGAQTPQLGGRYAHLVEDGMTSDEIARIEEEERQLDAAIEQAARH